MIGQYEPVETRSAAAIFWRVFGVALIVYIVGASVRLNLVDAVVGSLIFATVLCAWATKAPRGAAIGLAVFAALGTLSTIVLAVREQTWWWLGSAALDLAALIMAVRAIDPARSYLADIARRENAARDWDRKHRWDLDTDR